MVHKTLCLFSTHSSPLRNFSHVLKQQFLHINQSNLGKVPTPDLHNQLSGFADSYTYSAKNTKWILKSIIFFLSGFRNSQQNVKVLPTMSLSCITSVTWSKKDIQVHSNLKAAQRCALVLQHNHCYMEKPGLKCR